MTNKLRSIIMLKCRCLSGGGGEGGGGFTPIFCETLFRDSTDDQQTKARDRTFEGVPDSGCPPVPAGQPHPYLVNFWLNFANSPQHA